MPTGLSKEVKDFIKYTKDNFHELGEFLEKICQQEFMFYTEYPLMQAANNRQFLSLLDTTKDKRITLDYKVEFIKTVFSCWRENLKNYKEYYHSSGFLFYLFEDDVATLTITAVAQTSEGSPYPFLKLVPDIRQVIEINSGRSYSEDEEYHFNSGKEEQILKVIDQNKGSIGKSSADQLSLKVGELRKLITNQDMEHAVNEIRKKYKKRSADFSIGKDEDYPERFGWEGIIPPAF